MCLSSLCVPVDAPSATIGDRFSTKAAVVGVVVCCFVSLFSFVANGDPAAPTKVSGYKTHSTSAFPNADALAASFFAFYFFFVSVIFFSSPDCPRNNCSAAAPAADAAACWFTAAEDFFLFLLLYFYFLAISIAASVASPRSRASPHSRASSRSRDSRRS
jgi:uncharacterized BrkB/YihY/UPF0761 family membrane protein